MVIDFEKMESVTHSQFKGGNGDTVFRTFNDGMNKIMLGRLDVGCSIGYHSHETNSEMIYILDGEGCCLYDDGEERLGVGQCHYCPKGHAHGLFNASATMPLTFLAIVPEQ